MNRRKLAALIIVLGTPLFSLFAFEALLRFNKHSQFIKYNNRTHQIERFVPPSDDIFAEELQKRIAVDLKNFADYPTRALEQKLSIYGLKKDKKFPSYLFKKGIVGLKNQGYKSEIYSEYENTLLYSVNIHFDEYGTRKILNRPTEANQQFIFAGCSFTFGEGVEDWQHFPAYFQNIRPNSQVYNLGLGGSSEADVIKELESSFKHRYQKIPVTNGTFVYSFINDHINRMICPISCLNEQNNWILNRHWYEKDAKGNLIYKGLFRDRTTINLLYLPFANLELTKLLGLDWPLVNSKNSIEFIVEMTKKLKSVVETKLGIRNFYFAFLPVESSIASPQLEQKLMEADIKLLDLRLPNFHSLLNNKAAIPGDGHPTPLAHLLTAHMMDIKLQEQELKQSVDKVNTHALRSGQQKTYQ